MAQNPFKLDIYNESYKLSLDIFNDFKDCKYLRLRDQLLGSITSIPANIAEMGAFDNKNQIKQKLKTCISECNEAEFWLTFFKDSDIIKHEKYKEYINRIKKTRMMLYNLLKSI